MCWWFRHFILTRWLWAALVVVCYHDDVRPVSCQPWLSFYFKTLMVLIGSKYIDGMVWSHVDLDLVLVLWQRLTTSTSVTWHTKHLRLYFSMKPWSIRGALPTSVLRLLPLFVCMCYLLGLVDAYQITPCSTTLLGCAALRAAAHIGDFNGYFQLIWFLYRCKLRL